MKQLLFDWGTDPPADIPIQLLLSINGLCASMGLQLTAEEKAELIAACRFACAGLDESAFWQEVRRRMEIRERATKRQNDLNS